MPTPTERLFDEILSDALDVLRLSAAERAKVVRRLKQMERKLIAKLAEEDIEKVTLANVKKVLRKTAKIIKEHYALIQAELDLPTLAAGIAEITSHSIQLVLGPVAEKLPIPRYYASVASNVLIEGAPSSEWWQAQEADTRFKFANQVRAGLVAQETNQQIINRIVGTSDQAGIMETARRNAASLVQTSVQAVANDARRTTFEANDDVITAIQQVSTLDGHTTLICIAYSGKKWRLKDKKPIGHNLPFKKGTPRHFNCRSVEIPVTKTFAELGIDVPEPKGTTRASDIGQIDVNTDFNDFLKRRGVSYQDRVLGPGRADLWRAGKITLRDLVNGEGNPVSLERLREIARRKGARR
jgi:hypothetical protein